MTRSEKLTGHILAALELGYLYGTMKNEEDNADKYFQLVESHPTQRFSLKNRLTEFMVQNRVESIRTANEYHEEIVKMKIAAGIMYSWYHMDRQALDWFQEVSDHPVAHIMILYFTKGSVQLLSELMDRLETTSLDYYSHMALSYGQLRLGQATPDKALDYYTKAAAYLQNSEIYERLAEIQQQDTDLFRTLYHAARNDPDATFKLAQYYHDQDPEKAASHYLKAAKAGHILSCYYYAKYEIQQRQSVHVIPSEAAKRSKKAADLLRQSASKNHGPSYFELGQLEIAAGLYEEGVDDLKEAAFLQVGEASYRLGELYETGFRGTTTYNHLFRINPEPETAFKYYQDALDQNFEKARIKLGNFFENGWVVEQNLDQARTNYMKAMELCTKDAEYAMGCLEERLTHYQDAFRWFQKSNAMFKLGYFLLNGLVVVKGREIDVQDGVSILETEKRNNCDVQAIKELAKYYQEKQALKAFQYWKDATLFEDPEAYEFIATCFEKGMLGQPVNLEEAAEYKLKAIESRKRALETQLSTVGFKSDFSG